MDITLPKDIGPHDSANVEWWYCVSFLEGEHGGRYAVMASFFTVGELEGAKGHYLIFSIIDLKNNKFESYSVIDSNMLFGMLSFYLPFYLTQHPKDIKMQELYASLLKLKLPEPHKRMGQVFVKNSPTALVFGDKVINFTNEKAHNFSLQLSAGETAIELEFKPLKPVTFVGENGKPDNLYYYSFTKNELKGFIKKNNMVEKLKGTGWFDHQWGKEHRLLLNSGWCWFGLILDDGRELLINTFKYVVKDATYSPMANLIEMDGKLRFTREIALKPLKVWQSSSTRAKYPIAWEIYIPDFKMVVNVEAMFENQEMPIIGPLQAIWEGACLVNVIETLASQEKKEVIGRGFMELVGYANYNAKRD